MSRIYIDSETCGLHSMMVLLQYAEENGPIHLHDIWKRPVGETLEILEWFAQNTVVGFNLVFDWFHVAKIHTIWSLLNRDWIPEEHIDEIAEIEPQGRDGLCIKPYSALDLLLHSRKGPYQSLMAREDVRIRRVPIQLAYALAEELEKLIQLDGIYFARSQDKDAPRWHVYDIRKRDGTIDEHFKDVCLRFNPAGGLKFLAEHALGYEPKFHFKDVEPDTKLRPVELGYAPWALAVSNKAKDWEVYGKDDKVVGHAWPGVIRHHIDHWAKNGPAREYATDDIVYTRALEKHFAKLANLDQLPDGDNDSVLACMVPVVRWRGYKLDLEGIQGLLTAAEAVVAAAPVNINKPAEVRQYIGECMDDTEVVIIEETTRKSKLEAVMKWKVNTELEDDDTGAEGLQGWRINHSEDCSKCYNGVFEGKTCPRCNGTGHIESGLHPASKRAKEILEIKAAVKEVELLRKLLKAGRLHASFNIVGALSSRMTSGDGLNTQGIKNTKEVRKQFPLAWDGYILSGGDFDSYEVTIADSIYKDPGISELVISGKKIHAFFAMCMYPGTTYEEVLASEGADVDMYTDGKSGFFGMLYFGDWNTLVRNFGIAKDVAQAAERTFFERYPGIPKARQRIVDMFGSMTQPDGIGTQVIWKEPCDYIESLLGFRRYFTLENQICKALFGLAMKPPKHWRECKAKVVRRDRIQVASGAVASALYGAAFQLQAANTRAAGNHEIQSTGAEITKVLQRRIWNLQPHGVNDLMLMPMNIHDEIACPTRPHLADAISEIVVEVVESYRPKIPLIGMTWFKKMKNWAGKKGGNDCVEGQVSVKSPLIQKRQADANEHGSLQPSMAG